MLQSFLHFVSFVFFSPLTLIILPFFAIFPFLPSFVSSLFPTFLHSLHPSLSSLQCLQHRALHPDEPLPELSPVVAAGLKPPPAVEAACGVVMDKMKRAFKLKVVEQKKDEKTGDDLFKNKCVSTPAFTLEASRMPTGP